MGDLIRQPARRRFVLVIAALLVFTGLADRVTAADAGIPKNIIILFADGAAPVQWDFGRRSSELLRKQSFATTDVMFREGTLGLLSTQPHGPYVTDSAAAASAMSTGYKVVNGAVSITPDGKPQKTLMQAAKAAGKRIGLVTTATVYDATPAAFAVNARSRRDSQVLVDLLADLQPDVLMGGGAEYFLPASVAGGKRKDGRDVMAAFRAAGHDVVRDIDGLKAAKGNRLLGLFALEDMDFEIDRDPKQQPSTAEMAAAALRALSKDSPEGFVLLVENENTDTAGHANDAPALMRALWAFDDAVKVALEFQRRNPNTLLIVTGDHETGGFSPTYAQKDLSSLSGSNRFTADDEQFRMLERVSMSLGRLREHLGKKPDSEVLDPLLAKHFPGLRFDDDLRALLLGGKTVERNFTYVPQNLLGRMIARQTGFYWGTSGHTSEPVAVGAIGPGARLFHGFQDNTDFGRHLHRLVGSK
ncbi:MAG: alkaline phosphatase [Burkholderiales bacterium]